MRKWIVFAAVGPNVDVARAGINVWTKTVTGGCEAGFDPRWNALLVVVAQPVL